MPLVKRAVEPIFVSRATLSSQIKNELEGVVVNTLAGLIKQLSSVSKHAENLFGDLVNEANGIYLRTVSLSGRVAGLQDKIQTLDSGGKEDVRIEDFNARVFKSTNKEEQQILDRGTLPTALQEVYRSCNAPPALSQLSQYRDDGKDGLNFYTDPEYFFRLWVQDQTKQIEKKQKKKAKGARKKKESKKKKVKAVQKKQYAGVDKEFMEQAHLKEAPGDIIIGTPPTTRASTEIHAREAPPPPQPLSHAQMAAPTVPPPPPPPVPPSISSASAAPPPPPLPPGPMSSGYPPPPPAPPMAMGTPPMTHQFPPQTNYSQPPVPPPPAPPINFPAAPPPPPIIPAPQSAGPPPPPPPAMPSEPGIVGEIKKPPPEVDQRSAFLLAIEKGMHLRKVEKKGDSKPSSAYGNDVASILKRRIAFEVSDTESEDEDSEEEGSDEWFD